MSDIVVGSVAVDIVPDTRNLRRDIQAKVQGISIDIGVNADTTGIRAELDDLTRHRDATITANADVAEANAQLDITARDRTSTIRANVDESQVSAIGKLSSGLGGISGFAVSMIALGPALIPILAAVAAVGVALTAPLVIAGGGATLFGLLAGFAVKDTNEQLKAIDKQREKLSTLTKGTKEYSQAQADLKVLTSGLSPAQKKFSDALDHIKGSFATLLGGPVGDKLLAPVSAFLNIAADTLPKLAPVIGAVSDALSTLLGDLGKAVKSPDFKAFISTFADQVGPDIVTFGHIAGNVFEGVAGLVTQLGDAFGPGILKGLEKLTGKFADLGDQGAHSKALQDFVAYFKRVGPQVGDTLGAVAKAVGHIVAALAPLGPPALKVIEGIADAISGIPIPVLTGMTAAFVAVAGAAKVGKGLSALGLLGGGGLGKGGGGILGNLVGSAKPVPVFVTNQGFGGGGGVGGGKTGGNLAAIPLIGSFIAAGFFSKNFADNERARNLQQFGTNDVVNVAIVKLDRKLLAQGQSRSDFQNANVGPFTFSVPKQTQPANLKSTTDHVDGLQASLAKASRTIDLIGPHADIAFGQASKDVDKFSGKLAAIKDKKLRILLDDAAAVRSLQALQALRLKDKTLTINVERELDRVVGPGGGQGHPLGGDSGGAALDAAPRGSSSGRSGPLVHIENMQPHDYNDFLRQSQNRLISRGNGGVLI